MRIVCSLISLLSTTLASTKTVLFSLLTLQPRDFNISRVTLTSLKSGQLCITLSPLIKSVEARIGKAEFLAPWTEICPESFLPPHILKYSI